MRTMADATLGYVYVTAGAGRVPVYALGDSAANGDNDCYFQRWAESRVKKYVTSESERTHVARPELARRRHRVLRSFCCRRDTRPVYTHTAMGVNGTANRYYYVDGAEATKRGKAETAFQVLADGSRAGHAAADARLLSERLRQVARRAAPPERRASIVRAARATSSGLDLTGLASPVPPRLWSKLLADGCPYQGFFAPQAQPARDVYPAWHTLDQLEAPRRHRRGLHQRSARRGVTPSRSRARSSESAPGPKPDSIGSRASARRHAIGAMKEAPCGEPTATAGRSSAKLPTRRSLVHVRRDRSPGRCARCWASCGSTSAMWAPT